MRQMRRKTLNRFRQILGLGLVPAVAVGAGTVLSDTVRAESLIRSLDDTNDVQSSAEVQLCQPIFGNVATEKQIGIPIIIEDDKGDALTSLEGLTFELIAANGDTQSLSAEGLVSNSTGRTSTDLYEPIPQSTIRAYEAESGTTLLPREIKWLNCSPADNEVAPQNGVSYFTPAPFASGVKIVAKRNGSVIASGDLSERQAVNWSASNTLLFGGYFSTIYNNIWTKFNPTSSELGILNGCPVSQTDWLVGVANALGLQDDMYYQFWESEYCSGESPGHRAFEVSISQLYYRDAPLGKLRDVPTQDLSVQAVLDIASAGMREAVRLRTTVVPSATTTVAPTTVAPATTVKKQRVLPETGTDSSNIPIAIALLAGGAVLVVTRRHFMQQ